MERWVGFAFLSMLFAGLTSVIAKKGLDGISGELGLVVRTIFVSLCVMLFAIWAVPREQINLLTRSNLIWLGLSGLTTAASWVFYYKALKEGDVSMVALIDKGSFVVAVLLAWLVLGERISLKTVLGASLILAGILVVAKKS